jgi:sec-independent protein translocase protein TatB
MFLFILESIGTSELILIGVIALIFLGPRKLPGIARTIGKYMAEFRQTTSEFKSTWEKEVDFAMEEEETAKKDTTELTQQQVARLPEASNDPEIPAQGDLGLPEIKQIDESAFAGMIPEKAEPETLEEEAEAEPAGLSSPGGKQDWL